MCFKFAHVRRELPQKSMVTLTGFQPTVDDCTPARHATVKSTLQPWPPATRRIERALTNDGYSPPARSMTTAFGSLDHPATAAGGPTKPTGRNEALPVKFD